MAERFHPDKIILFGSYAYGTPHADSDVDILVVMPTRNKHGQAVRIRREVPALFAMDLIVRTPREMKWRLAEGDTFHSEIVSRGKVLHEEGDGEWVDKAEADFRGAKSLARSRPPLHDLVCFHCQQCAEKDLKAHLEELGIAVAKTHELDRLLAVLLPFHPNLRSLKRGLDFLTDFAVDTRYPGNRANKREAASALRWAGRVRSECRGLLGLGSS